MISNYNSPSISNINKKSMNVTSPCMNKENPATTENVTVDFTHDWHHDGVLTLSTAAL